MSTERLQNRAGRMGVVAVLASAAVVMQAAGQTVPVPVRVVALSGQPIAGGPAGTVIVNSSLMTQQLSLNGSGRVAFIAEVDDPVNPVRRAVISDVGGQLRIEGLAGEAQPQFPFATTFSTFGDVLLTDGAMLSVEGSTQDLASTKTTLSRKSFNEPWEIVVRDGDPAVGTGTGVSYLYFSPIDLAGFRRNAFGNGAFRTGLANGGVTGRDNLAIYRATPVGETLAYRTGDAPPSSLAPTGSRYTGFSSSLSINDANQLCFVTQFELNFVSTDIVTVDSNGVLREVARERAVSPGYNGVFQGFVAFTMNQNGRVAFAASVDGNSPTPDAFGVWLETSAGTRFIAATDTPAPGVAGGLSFASIFTGPGVLNDEGQLAFFARLGGGGVTSSNDTALYVFDGQQLQLMIREGVQQAPGLPAGIALSGLFGSGDATTDGIQLNNQGQFVFRSTITGAGVTSSNNQVLWEGKSAATLRPIVRSGQTVDVDNRPEVTTLRTIQSIVAFQSGSGTAGGEPRVLNENQELMFGVQFTDGSRAVLVANLACVRVDQQPIGTQVCPGATVPLVAIGQASGPVTYQWQRQVAGGAWTNLANGVQADGSTVAGVDQTQLTLGNVRGGISQYRAVMSSACGSTNSAPATVRVTRQCGLADVAGQGGAILPCGDEVLDNNDFVVFIGWFFERDVNADVAGDGASEGADGAFDNNDFVLFIQRFFTGC